MPGAPAPISKPGHYVYGADGWSFFVNVDPVTDTVREFVVAEDRGPVRQYLETIRQGMLSRPSRTASDADFEGYPSLRFSADAETEDKQQVEGKYWLLVTDQHFYILLAIGPKGTSNANADRFLESFRLVKTTTTVDSAGTTATAATPSKGPLAAKLTAPMLAVALLITEEQLNPRIDEAVQNAPPAKHLGDRWNSTSPAWQKARTSFTSRIARIAEAYEETGEMDRTFDAALAHAAPDSQAVDALVAALNGPTGPEILREYALLEFLSTVRADDLDGPKPGERAWMEQTGSLVKIFDQRLGSVMPRDKAREADVAQFFSTPPGEVLRNLWSAVVGKATTQIRGAVNLMVFDEGDAIRREIEAAVASVK
jgi:hypothetical protein